MGSKASIIITFYNNPVAEVVRCIESAIKQSDDVIVINGGSTVEYPEFKYPITYIKMGYNAYEAECRNVGVKLIKYDRYITLDGDDYLIDGSIAKLLETDADIVYGNMITPSGRCKPIVPITREGFKRGNQLFATSLLKKSVWEKVGGYWERGILYPCDWEFWARTCANGAEFKYVDVDVYNYQTGNPNSGWERAKHTSWNDEITKHAGL